MDKTTAYKRIENHYRGQRDRLVQYSNKFFHNVARAEDCVQDAYVNALTYWETMPEAEEEFMPWFQTILSNCIRKNHRDDMLHGMSEVSEDENPEEPSVKPVAIPQIIIAQVMDRIKAKSKEHANVLTLSLINQYGPKDVEKITDISANNVRQIVHNFRQEIRQEFRWVI